MIGVLEIECGPKVLAGWAGFVRPLGRDELAGGGNQNELHDEGCFSGSPASWDTCNSAQVVAECIHVMKVTRKSCFIPLYPGGMLILGLDDVLVRSRSRASRVVLMHSLNVHVCRTHRTCFPYFTRQHNFVSGIQPRPTNDSSLPRPNYCLWVSLARLSRGFTMSLNHKPFGGVGPGCLVHTATGGEARLACLYRNIRIQEQNKKRP